VPLRSHAPFVGTVELLERTGELSLLREQLAEVAACSRGRLVLVRGEAGIGKTALLRRFCAEAGEPARLLWASCDPLFTPRLLGPFLDIARETAGGLRDQLEEGGQPHDVAAALLRELESPKPMVLVLEDLHWGDEATLDVVRLVGRRVETVPALLIGSYRASSCIACIRCGSCWVSFRAPRASRGSSSRDFRGTRWPVLLRAQLLTQTSYTRELGAIRSLSPRR